MLGQLQGFLLGIVPCHVALHTTAVQKPWHEGLQAWSTHQLCGQQHRDQNIQAMICRLGFGGGSFAVLDKIPKFAIHRTNLHHK